MLSQHHEQHGATLVELMIAGLIALIALSAVVTVYSASARHSAALLQQAQLHQQLHTLMQLMSRDLKRAGYWYFDPGVRPATDNPFQNSTNRLQVQAYPSERPDSCILFAYDLDQDGLVGVGVCSDTDCPDDTDDDNVEQFGFRLRDAKLQARYGGPVLDCEGGYWQTLNDPAIEITGLGFTRHARCLNLRESDRACTADVPQLVQRVLQIQISGQLRNKPDSNRTITRWLRIRNDRLSK